MVRIVCYHDSAKGLLRRPFGKLILIFCVLCIAFCASIVLQMRAEPGAQQPSTLLQGEKAPERTGETAKLISVPYISQKPDFPTGCESVSAVMVLHYYGETITVGEFIDRYLPCDGNFFTENGQLFGPDPSKTFVGNPRTEDSFGCFAPVIESALNQFAGAQKVLNTTGMPLADLCEQFIDANRPVLVWASMDMKPTYPARQWILPNGQIFRWTANEHCLVLIGYDAELYYFGDPLAGAVVGYERQTVETRYSELGMQSLVYLG